MTTKKLLHPYFTFERRTFKKKSMEFYLDFENSSSLTNFGFSDTPRTGGGLRNFFKNNYVASDRYAHLLRGGTKKITVKDPPLLIR